MLNSPLPVDFLTVCCCCWWPSTADLSVAEDDSELRPCTDLIVSFDDAVVAVDWAGFKNPEIVDTRFLLLPVADDDLDSVPPPKLSSSSSSSAGANGSGHVEIKSSSPPPDQPFRAIPS